MNIHTLKRLFALQYPVVQTASIVDGSVTAAKLADGSVTAAKLADGSVTAAKLPDGSVTAAKLADGSVTAAKLAQVGGLSMIPLVQFRKADGTRSALGAAGSNSLGISAASGVSLLTTSDAKQAIKTETAAVELTIPTDYVAGEAMSLQFRCAMQGTPAVSKKLKVLAIYHPFDEDNITVINNDEQTIPDGISTLTYNITSTALQPGGLLSIVITCTLNDTGGDEGNKLVAINGALLSYKRYV